MMHLCEDCGQETNPFEICDRCYEQKIMNIAKGMSRLHSHSIGNFCTSVVPTTSLMRAAMFPPPKNGCKECEESS